MQELLIGGLIGAMIGLAMAFIVMARAKGNAALKASLAALEAALQNAADQKAQLAQTQERTREAFSALSHEALRQNRQDFLHNADALLKPVRETLDRVQDQLATVDKAREGSFQAVATQLSELGSAQKQLREAAEGLTRSLKSPNVRGRWGELQLRRIVELAGMIEQCDFVEKPTAETDDGSRQYPDLIVKLPNHATIVVDAKVPIDAYLAASDAQTEPERQQRLALHVRQVREHIRTLAAKEYWKQFEPSPEFVIMFLPLEPLLATALEQDTDLLEQAAGLRIIPATPLTLLALLKAAALGWRQEQLARNAEEIQLIGRELYERLGSMVGHLQGVGKNLKQAGDAYDRFVGSLESKVLPGARRFKELGVNTTADLESPEQIRLALRSVTKPELTGRLPEDAGDPKTGFIK
ncbi:MAG TPA: DNA recombination protein RmuC [Vicinamibacterales bacterium]|nr:DNA recombination protein RmuC [Vicinamibacterales bacterium]